MCFRPATTVTVVKCLECGAFNKPDNETCQKCGADLTASKEEANKGAAPASGAPKPEISLTPQGLDNAPKAPGAPAPSAPKAPGAPKPPTN